MQTDPLGYEDNANLYAYVGNDPINLIDPLGLCSDSVTGSDKWIVISRCRTRGGGGSVGSVGGLSGSEPGGREPGKNPARAKAPPQKKLRMCLVKFLNKFAPSVDWSKVTLTEGGALPGMAATTYGNNINFDKGVWSHISMSLLFHELGHVPQWSSGRLTYGSYIGQAVGSWFRYAGEASSTYGMFPASKSPPSTSIHDGIPLEQDANAFRDRLMKAYGKAKPCG